jgi:hypothetical protein
LTPPVLLSTNTIPIKKTLRILASEIQSRQFQLIAAVIGWWQRGGARGVDGVVEQVMDVVHEEGKEVFCYLFLVCEGEGAFVWDPRGGKVVSYLG